MLFYAFAHRVEMMAGWGFSQSAYRLFTLAAFPGCSRSLFLLIWVCWLVTGKFLVHFGH